MTKTYDFKPIGFANVPRDDDACEECGGMGEIIDGDGGTGVYGEYSETGGTDRCSVCGGTGDGGLFSVAREKLGFRAPREASPADRSSSPSEEVDVLT